MEFDPAAKPTKKVTPPAPASGERKYGAYEFNPSNKPEDLAKHIINEKEPGKGLVPFWSVSRLHDFETCRWRTYLRMVLKLPEESHPAAERGIAWHDNCEAYVNGELGEFPKEMTDSPKFMRFMNDFNELREQYAEGLVSVEGEWAFTTDWDPVDWRAKDVWGRVKLDVMVWENTSLSGAAKIIDHKTGKKFGNEVKHADQGMIYTVTAFMRHPQLDLLDLDFWYLDQAEKSFPQRYTRAQAMTFLPRITERATIMTSAKQEDFFPSPSIYNCRYCPFNREEKGCEYRFIG